MLTETLLRIPFSLIGRCSLSQDKRHLFVIRCLPSSYFRAALPQMKPIVYVIIRVDNKGGQNTKKLPNWTKKSIAFKRRICEFIFLKCPLKYENYVMTRSRGHSLFSFNKKQVWFEHALWLQELMPCPMPFPSPSSTTRRSSSPRRKAPVISHKTQFMFQILPPFLLVGEV